MNAREHAAIVRKPKWLSARIPSGAAYFALKRRLEERKLSTICQSARCPNIDECWNHGYATFLAMGDICTRCCRFCSVAKGTPLPLDEGEPERILEMSQLMDLHYLVVTSVTRDDLPDRGSGHMARILRTLRRGRPEMRVELLVPDFGGEPDLLDEVIDAAPDVFSHNLETVRSLYPAIGRPAEGYEVSLEVLGHAKKRGMITKSGLMAGLGETGEQLCEAFSDLHRAGVDLLTIGQYLQPKPGCAQVKRFLSPEDFSRLREVALESGFVAVESGPFVRSSYRAERLYETVRNEIPGIQ